MSKKKKKKKSRSNYYYCEHPVVSDKDLKYMLSGVDKTIDNSYNSLLDEIRKYQLDIKLSDVEAEKKQRKRLKKELGVIPYYCRKEQVEARKRVLEEMEAKKTFDRIELAFKNIVPVVVIIAKLVAALITSILGLKTSMGYINPTTLNRLNIIKSMASAIS
jgi:hypothetical protein